VPTTTLSARAALSLIRGYRRYLSPLLGQRCRFHPSCSCYATDAIERHGAARGAVLAFFRIVRCNPLCEGGMDPVPARFPRRFWRRSEDGNE
jgi:uncharacterized protein